MDMFRWFVFAIYFYMLTIQIFTYGASKHIHTEAGNTWQVFYMSGGISPPDQTFSWHQARFFRNHLTYGTDSFYNDIDLYDRTYLGGFLTSAMLCSHEIAVDAYPDTTFAYDRIYSLYRLSWWALHNLVIIGAGLFFFLTKKRKTGYIVLLFLAHSSLLFFLSAGLWVKILPVYLLMVALFLHQRKTAYCLQSLLLGSAFFMHGSLILFIFPILLLKSIYIIRFLLSIISKQKKKAFSATNHRALKEFATCASVSLIVLLWFGLAHYNGSPQALAFSYRYDADWTELQSNQESAKKLLIDRFYAQSTPITRTLVPVSNMITSIFPLHVLRVIDRITLYNPKSCSSLNFINAVAWQNWFSPLSFLGVTLYIPCLLGFIYRLKNKKTAFTVLFIYVIPTVTGAILYRKNDIISNHIFTGYILFVIFIATSFTEHYLNNRKLISALCFLQGIEFFICLHMQTIRTNQSLLSAYSEKVHPVYFITLIIIAVMCCASLILCYSQKDNATAKINPRQPA
ncbi:MAG: hypothetical protein EOL87_12540 [Spartobacteria bacterium]|nr:hypothetical protein [Spartobacteria bacterium]